MLASKWQCHQPFHQLLKQSAGSCLFCFCNVYSTTCFPRKKTTIWLLQAESCNQIHIAVEFPTKAKGTMTPQFSDVSNSMLWYFVTRTALEGWLVLQLILVDLSSKNMKLSKFIPNTSVNEWSLISKNSYRWLSKAVLFC